MSTCAFCWADAWVRAQGDTSKSQTEHYMDIMAEADGGACRSTQAGRNPDAEWSTGLRAGKESDTPQ